MSTIVKAPPAVRIRQSYLTFLLDHCPSGAWALVMQRRDGPSYVGATRGLAIHEFFSGYNEHLFAVNRQTDWEAAEKLADEVLARYPELPFAEREDARAQMANIAQGYVFEPSTFYGTEEALETTLDLEDGREVLITGRLDLLLVSNAEAEAIIRDVKGNHRLPPDSEILENNQLRTYAMLVLDNLPHVDRVKGELWFTRYGKLLPQRTEAVWDREDIETFKAYLRPVLRSFLDAKTHEATPSTQCQYCPRRRPGGCTLWRSYYGTTPPPPLTQRQALKLARQVVTLEQARDERVSLLKEYINEHGPLRLGSSTKAETFGFHASESEEFDAGEFLEVLRDPELVSLAGEQPVGQLFSVNKRSRTFRQIRHHRDLKHLFDDIAETRVSTRFGHRSAGGDEA